MKKIFNSLKKNIKNMSKGRKIIYLTLRFLIIICMIREFMNGNIQNGFLCILSLFLFLLPSLAENIFKIDLPEVLEIAIYLFIFSAEILGEINNFYGLIPSFDNVLHTINGFLSASIGFSLIYLLNENIKNVKLSPIFVAIVAFCFSMTIGIIWEFFEYGMDTYFNLDMQKDEYVYNINTVMLDLEMANNVVLVDDIAKTIVYDSKGQELATFNGYLDIGLNDTMKDLIVNFLGAFVFSILDYLYIKNKDKYKFIDSFMTKKRVENSN